MKFKIYSLLLSFFIIVTISSCVKSNATTQTAVVVPSGTFTGKFAFIHRQYDYLPYDTAIANITLTLSSNNFAVTGDTTTLHAGSFGYFTVDQNQTYMLFNDKTYPVSTAPKKIHLSGLYLYNYDGTTLKLLANASDTVSYQYQLTKSN